MGWLAWAIKPHGLPHVQVIAVSTVVKTSSVIPFSDAQVRYSSASRIHFQLEPVQMSSSSVNLALKHSSYLIMPMFLDLDKQLDPFKRA